MVVILIYFYPKSYHIYNMHNFKQHVTYHKLLCTTLASMNAILKIRHLFFLTIKSWMLSKSLYLPPIEH
jgi:hypothetical protein